MNKSSSIPLVSIIVPVYNVEKYLKQCINSVLMQDSIDYELILINDGSTDYSLQICREFESMDSRVILIDSKNEGVGLARNKGLKIAKGKYIYFLDSDDFLNPVFFNSVKPFLTTENDYDVIQFGFNRVNEGSEFLNKVFPGFGGCYSLLNNRCILAKLFAKGVGLVVWDKLIKRELIERADIKFDSKVRGEDYTFIAELFLKSSSLFVINESLINYRILFNIKRKYNPLITEHHIENFARLIKLFKNCDNNYMSHLNKLFVWWFLVVIPLTVSGYHDLSISNKRKMLNKIYDSIEIKNYIKKNKLANLNIKLLMLRIIIQFKLSRMHLIFGNLISQYRKFKYN